MKKIVIAVVAILTALAGWYVFQSKRAPTSEDVVHLLIARNPDLAKLEVELEACQLRMRSDGILNTGVGFVLFDTSIDLREFYFVSGEDKMILRPANGEKMTLVGSRVPVNEAFIDRVLEVAELSGDQGQVYSRESLFEILNQDGARLVFRVMSVTMEGDTEPRPNKDAPAFYAFAKKVIALEDRVSTAVVLSFSGPTDSEETFQNGSVTIPNEVTLAANSVDDARQMVGTIRRYRAAFCPE